MANKISSICREKRYLLCHRIILLNLKRRSSASVWKKDGQLTASPRNTAFPKKASAGGAINSGKNARPKAFRLLRPLMEAEIMKDSLRLRREPAEKAKEILFLKKAAAFFAKETGQRLIGLPDSITENPASAGC